MTLILRAGTIRKKLPLDAINPAHESISCSKVAHLGLTDLWFLATFDSSLGMQDYTAHLFLFLGLEPWEEMTSKEWRLSWELGPSGRNCRWTLLTQLTNRLLVTNLSMADGNYKDLLSLRDRHGEVGKDGASKECIMVLSLEASVRLGHKTLRTLMKRSSLW